MSYIMFENILGKLIFDEKGNFVDKLTSKNKDRYKRLMEPTAKQMEHIFETLKSGRFHKEFNLKNIERTKKDMRESSKEDIIIIETIKSMNELEKVRSVLLNRLREWYAYYNPEFVESIGNQEKFVELLIKKDRSGLLKEIGVKENMGIELSKKDVDEIRNLAKEIQNIDSLRNSHEEYLKDVVNKVMPNTVKVATAELAAELLEIAGGLRNLMELPSSTIQLLGAEKSLFRHLKNKKNRSPKYGILYNHPLVQKAKNKGKAARIVASKIDIAVKVDYFKGKYIGDRLLKEVEKKIE